MARFTLMQRITQKTVVVDDVPADVEAAHGQPPPRVTQLIEDVLAARSAERRYFRPSMIAGCARQNVFFYMGAPENPQNIEPGLHKILDTGTALHRMVQGYLAEHPGVFYVPEVLVWMPDLEIQGHSDGLFVRRSDGYRWGLELKTTGSKKFGELKEPKPDHVAQASIYAQIMGVHWMSLVYLNRDSLRTKEYPVPRSNKRWKELTVRVRGFQEHTRKKTLPVFNQEECDGSYDFCAYSEHCFHLLNRPHPTRKEGFGR